MRAGRIKQNKRTLRMKRVVALLFACAIAFPLQVIEVNAASLDEVIAEEQTNAEAEPVEQQEEQVQQTQQTQESQPVQQTTNGAGYVSSSNFIDGLDGTLNVIGEQSQELSSLQSALQKAGRLISQALILVITFYLPIRVLIDAVFIVVPPLQSTMACGRVGNVVQSASMQNGQMQNGNMGMNGAMGGMYGRGNMGMGGMYGRGGMGMNQMGMQGMPGQQGMPTGNGFCIVSQAALNAVATEQAGDGKVATGLKVYAKESTAILIIMPLLLFLFGSGILQKIGFALSDKIVQGLANLLSGM